MKNLPVPVAAKRSELQVMSPSPEQLKKGPLALIIQGNTMEYVSNCMDCPHSVKIDDPDPLDWFADKEQSLMCNVHAKEDAGRKIVPESERDRGTRQFEISPLATINPMESWDSAFRAGASVPSWCRFLVKE